MADFDDGYVPYAGISGVVTVLRRLRAASLPDVLDAQSIERIGISKGIAGRTIAAIRFLGIVDEGGNKTEIHDRLAKASTNEYPSLLAEVLRSAYAEIFKVVDPADASDVELHDAFRGFDPAKQRGRMVSLFIGLCQEAGIIEGEPTVTQRRRTETTGASGSENGASKLQGRKKDEAPPPPYTPPNQQGVSISERYEMLAAVFKKLPENGKWAKKEMELWLKGVSIAAEIEVELVGETVNSE